jgi:hypothetical protein
MPPSGSLREASAPLAEVSLVRVMMGKVEKLKSGNSHFKNGTLSKEMYSPHTLLCGYVFFSASATVYPLRAACMAKLKPAKPPPTTKN